MGIPDFHVRINMEAAKRELSERQYVLIEGEVLHFSANAAARARDAVLTAINGHYPTISIEDLQRRWVHLGQDENIAISQNGGHAGQVRSWLRKLVQPYGVYCKVPFIEELVQLHHDAYQSHLTLRPGGVSLVQTLKEAGKDIVFISTQRPLDTQEWVLKQLGLWEHKSASAYLSKDHGDEKEINEVTTRLKLWQDETVYVQRSSDGKLAGSMSKPTCRSANQYHGQIPRS